MAVPFLASVIVEPLIFMGLFLPQIFAASELAKFESEKDFLANLLSKERYDQHVLPAAPEKTIVHVSVLMLSMSSPDESSLKYEIEFLLIQDWQDPRLSYQDSGRHKYLNALKHRDELWRPDTYFILHGELKTLSEAGPIDMSFKVYPNGTVAYITRQKMIINCEGDLNIFPFDNPRCFFAVESMSYENHQLEFRWKREHPNRIFNSNSFRSLNAYLSKNATGSCRLHHSWRTEFSCLSVYLIFTRDKLFYFSTVFVPGMVLVTSSFISFWLDVNAVPARVMIGVTTMLNFCTTTNSFRSSLPVVSNLTAMNLWDGACMFFIYASMIEFIIVNYLHRKMHQTNRPTSSEAGEALRTTLNNQIATNGRKIIEANTKDTIHQRDFEVRAPLVSGEDPTMAPVNHRGLPAETSVAVGVGTAGSKSRSPDSTQGRLRAAASVFAWLRRPQWNEVGFSSHARRARSIDHISKFVFPFLFGVFSVSFFIYFAWFSPAKLDSWADEEYQRESKFVQ